MLLHQSKFVEIIYEKENSLIIDKFLSSTEDMKTSEFKEEMQIFVKKCEEHKPQRELVHLLDMKYAIVPEVQEWMNEEVFPKYKNIIKRMAFLMPTAVISHVAVEQTMEEEAGQGFVQKYFDNEKNAREWLMAE